MNYVALWFFPNGRSELRACYPLDLSNIIVSISEYEKRPPQMTKTDIIYKDDGQSGGRRLTQPLHGGCVEQVIVE